MCCFQISVLLHVYFPLPRMHFSKLTPSHTLTPSSEVCEAIQRQPHAMHAFFLTALHRFLYSTGIFSALLPNSTPLFGLRAIKEQGTCESWHIKRCSINVFWVNDLAWKVFKTTKQWYKQKQTIAIFCYWKHVFFSTLIFGWVSLRNYTDWDALLLPSCVSLGKLTNLSHLLTYKVTTVVVWLWGSKNVSILKNKTKRWLHGRSTSLS